MSETTTIAARKSPLRWAMLAGVWLVYFCFGLTVSALAPLVAPITRDLSMSYTEMGTVLGSWQLVYIFAAVPGGILVDRLKPRRAILLGALLMAASGFARAYSQDFWTLLLAVGVLFGIGGPIISTGAPKVVSQWFDGNERSLAMGIYISGPFSGGVTTLVLTNSQLMPYFEDNWRHVLLLWACLSLAAAALWWLISSNETARELERDVPGQTRVPSGQEIRALLAIRPVQVLLAMSICIFMINHGFGNWMPRILEVVGGLSGAAAGYYAALPGVVAVLGSLVIPRLATPERRLAILALLAIFAGLGTLSLFAEPGPVLAGGLVLQGLARGAMMTIAILVLLELPQVGERRAGTASGLFFSAAEIGGVGGPLTLGIVYDVTGSFAAGIWLMTGFAALVLAATLVLRALTKTAAPDGD